MVGLGRRACSLIVVLALLLGSSGWQWRPRPCVQCAPTCPMHAKRLGCHHGARAAVPRCDGAGSPSFAAGGCTHTESMATALAWRAIVPPRADARPALVSQRVAPPAARASTRPFPRPPSEPPRAPAAVA